MLYESLVVVRKQKWAPELVDNLAQVFADLVMNPNSDLIPDGLKIHFADIYLEEVEKVGGEQVSCNKWIISLATGYSVYGSLSPNSDFTTWRCQLLGMVIGLRGKFFRWIFGFLH